MYQNFTCLVCVTSVLFWTPPSVANEPNKPNKPLKFDTALEPASIKGTQEVVLDLGDQLCNDSLDVEWLITNALEQDVDWPRSTSSCGCISAVPQSLNIEGKRSGSQPATSSANFKIKLPAKPESLKRQIFFWDAGGTAHLQANIKVNVLPLVRFEKGTIELTDESKSTHAIKFTSATHDIDLKKQKITIDGAEVVSSRFESIDSKSGMMYMELDPKLLPPDTIQSELSVETVHQGVSTYQFIVVQYTHRTIVIPKIPSIVKQGDEYQCEFVVRSTGLTNALAHNMKLKAFAIDGGGTKSNKKTMRPLAVEATPNTTAGSSLNKVSISIQAPSQGKEAIPGRILLQCGDWEYEFECQLPPN